MKNSITKFDTLDIYDDYIVTDYSSRKLYDIYKLEEINDSDYIDYYQLSDNETIELVSYKLYGTTQYWDVLIYINQADPLFDMVYSFDFSSDIASDFIDTYNLTIYSNPSLPSTYLEELRLKKINELEEEKEIRRPIKIIRPNKMLDFMKLLRQSEII